MQFAGRIVAGLAHGVSLILVARELGPAEYGLFALVVTLAVIAMVVAEWGLSLVGTRAIADGRHDTQAVLRGALALRLWLAVGATVVLIALAFASSDSQNVHIAALVAGAGFLPQAWFGVAQIKAQVDMRLERVAVANSIAAVAGLAWIILCLARGWGIVALASVFIVRACVSAVVSAAMTPGGLPLMPSGDRELWRNLMRESTPLAASYMLVTVYFYIDVVLLARLSTSTEVGLYDSAYRFVQFGLFLPIILITSIYAEAARLAKHDPSRFQRMARELLSLTALLVPLPLLILAFSSSEVIEAVYGPAFSDAASTLVLLALALSVMVLTGVIGPLIVALGGERITLKIGAAATVVNVAANVALIPTLKADGAAVATLLTEFVVLAYAAIVLRRMSAVRFDGAQAAKVALSFVGGAVLVKLTPGDVIAGILAGVVAYIALLVLTGALGRRQLELTAGATRRSEAPRQKGQ